VIDTSVIAKLIMREGNYVEAAREIETKTIMTFSLRSAPATCFAILSEVEWRIKRRGFGEGSGHLKQVRYKRSYLLRRTVP